MTLLQDVRYGTRMCVKEPGFAFIVILTLALAIGANTVIFTFTNVLVLRPLPLKDPDTLGWIYNIDPQRGSNRARLSYPDFVDYRDSLRSFSDLAGHSEGTLMLTGRGEAQRVSTQRVSANLHAVWGLKPIVGRLFQPGEDAPSAPPVVILSHRFWQRQFAGHRAIVGHVLTFDGTACCRPCTRRGPGSVKH